MKKESVCRIFYEEVKYFMTSFLNKKLTIVFLVLASLLVLTSLGAVSAASGANGNVTAVASWDNGADTINTTTGSILKLNGTVYNNTPSGVPQGKLNESVVIYKLTGVTGWVVDNVNIFSTGFKTLNNGNGMFTAEIDTLNLAPGTYDILVFWQNDTTAWDGPVTVGGMSFNANMASFITGQPNGTAKVGVPGNFTLKVLSNGTPVNGTAWLFDGVTNHTNISIVDGIGNVLVTYTSIAPNFSFGFDGNTTANISASIGYWNGPVTKGTLDNMSAWFTSPFGYMVGETAVIEWIFGVNASTFAGQYVIIQFYDNGKLQHSFYAPADALQTTYTWKKAHDNLTMYVILPGSANYAQASAVNWTFVDQNSTRRTTISMNGTGVNGTVNLKVGVLGTINIQVFNYMGALINEGTVLVQFDNYDPFVVDIINGTAVFDHTFIKAGAARLLTVTYLGDNDNRASSVNRTVAVAKGDVNMTVVMIPPNTIVGVENTITTTILGIAASPTTRYVNINFVEGGKVLHTEKVAITLDGVTNIGTAILNYAFKKPHTSINIVASLVADNDYNGASANVTAVVGTSPI